MLAGKGLAIHPLCLACLCLNAHITDINDSFNPTVGV